MKILGQYTISEGDKAVSHALALIIEYMRVTQTAKRHEDFARAYAPSVLNRRLGRSAKAVVVFDIDDTLIFDSGDKNKNLLPHQVVLDLLLRLRQLGAEVHLVTARLNVPEMVSETRQELKSLGIEYESLTLAPSRNRSSLAAVSKWKMMTRKQIASEFRAPITLTVGDQWGDMVVLKNEDEIDALDAKHSAIEKPYILVRPGDSVSLWGLKLPAYN